MKIKVEKTINLERPKGEWQIKKWNLLKGETEADAEVIEKNNTINKKAFLSACFGINPDRTPDGTKRSPLGSSGYSGYGAPEHTLVPQMETPLPFDFNTELTDYSTLPTSSSVACDAFSGVNLINFPTEGASTYLWPTGVTSSDAGKVIHGFKLFAEDSSIRLEGSGAYLALQAPITLLEGDVIKVTCKLTNPYAGNFSITATGSLVAQEFAYGTDPNNPAQGAAGDTFAWSLSRNSSYSGAARLPLWSDYLAALNVDGNLEFNFSGKFTSSVKPVSGSSGEIPSIVIPNVGTLTFTDPAGSRPKWEPGTYYECEVDLKLVYII